MSGHVATEAGAQSTPRSDPGEVRVRVDSADSTEKAAAATAAATLSLAAHKSHDVHAQHHAVWAGKRVWQMNSEERSRYARYVFRHPASRLFVAGFITLCNFLIYAEDPVADSQGDAILPMIGRASSLIFTQWPHPYGGLMFAKVLCVLLALTVGPVVGRQVIHKKFLNKRYKMFFDDKGTFMIMFLTTLVTLFFFSLVYSGIAGAVLSDNAEDHAKYVLDDYLGIWNQSFMKGAATGTWLGDSITFFMVLDMIMQDQRSYKAWAPKAREFWRLGYGGKFRIICFWALMTTFTGIVVGVIFSSAIKWDELNGNWQFRTTELGRAVLAGFITLLDLCIVMQDWEFPDFETDQDIKLPGLGVQNVDFKFMGPFGEFFQKPFFHVFVTGKWFNYGIIFIVMLLDMNMLKNQVVYLPSDYAQYADPDGFVWSITNQTLIDLRDPALMTYESRVALNQTGDFRVNARWVGFGWGVKALSLLPVVAGFASFFFLIRKERRERQAAKSGIVTTAVMARSKALAARVHTAVAQKKNPAVGTTSSATAGADGGAAALAGAGAGDAKHGDGVELGGTGGGHG